MGFIDRILPGSFAAPEGSLDFLTRKGEEASPESLGLPSESVEGLWQKIEALYRSGSHPAIQLCIRRGGAVVLNRSLGRISGREAGQEGDAPEDVMDLDTPVGLFSASKAVTAMLIHKLDEEDVLRLDDRVVEYIPEFARHGKDKITVRHVLGHRAGLPKLDPEALDLDLLSQPERIVEIMCDAEPESEAGGRLAYHAMTGGFILAEVARRASGRSVRSLVREKMADPLGLRWLNYGVEPDDVGKVAINAMTGLPNLPPISLLVRRALSSDLPSLVESSNDPRFLTGIVPAANIVSTAHEMATFYQCLLDGGRYGEKQVFEERTIRQATDPQTGWELDYTLMIPVPYSLGFMLGSRSVGLFGFDNPQAFGHVGLSNVFTWADPERQLTVALLTTGKPILGMHIPPLLSFLYAVGRVFPKQPDAGRGGLGSSYFS
ncbi:MAG: serine hydrolase domain-containing protein [Myxococcota bacterium]|nr:serine hydrolase domain-containing protein [Myxococcota bacterium]